MHFDAIIWIRWCRCCSRGTALILAICLAAKCFFTFVHDSAPARMIVFTIAQTLPLAA